LKIPAGIASVPAGTRIKLHIQARQEFWYIS